MEVIISAETETWVTRERDPNDSWDCGDTEGRVSNVRAIIKTDTHSTEYWGASICKEFPDETNMLYAVVADYSSGSTFGRDGGHASVIDAFESEDDAKELCGIAKKVNRSQFSFDYYKTGKSYSASWTGYFEYLNSIDVWQVPITNGYSHKLLCH